MKLESVGWGQGWRRSGSVCYVSAVCITDKHIFATSMVIISRERKNMDESWDRWKLSLFQHVVSSPAVPWQRLLTVEILQLRALKSSLHRLPYRTHSQLTTLQIGIKHPCGAYDQIFITVRQLRVCWCGVLSLMRGRVVYNCCWPSPAQSFSGLSPVGLATIFYCLRFETSFPSPRRLRNVVFLNKNMTVF
jgi:hypothetical protein